MSIKAKCQKLRVRHAKGVLDAIRQEVEENVWSVEGKMLLPEKSLSAMELNIARLPGVFSFRSAVAGHKVPPKFYVREESGRFSRIPADQEAKVHELTDAFIVRVECANGQLGPLDSEYFIHLEKLLFDRITDTGGGFVPDRNEKMFLGTYYDFLSKSVGPNQIGGSSYRYLENFFHRITGLNISYYGKARYRVKYKMNDVVKERTVSGNYHPFRNFLGDGELGGNKGIWLDVDADYLSNIYNGYSKLVYNELVKNVEKSSSKFLFRYLTLYDQKCIIPVKYSELTHLMGLTRHTKKSDIKTQIGNIARGINNEKHGNLLVYASINDESMFGRNFPFIMKPMKDKKDFQLLFCLNTYVTPDMHDYGVQTIARSIVEQKQKRFNEVYNAMTEIANAHDMTLREYLDSGLPAVTLARAYGLTDDEIEKLKKRARQAATEVTILGKKAKNAYKTFDEAVNGLEETKTRRAAERREAAEQSITKSAETPPPKRGRGRPKGGSDLPF